MSRPTSPLVMIAGVGAAAVATVGFVLYRLSRTISCTREALHQRVSELEADSQRRLDRIQRGAERSMALNRVHELEPSRVELAALPTPTISLSLPWLQDAFVTLKMDSDTGCELSGNKVRKLEYVVVQWRVARAARPCEGVRLSASHRVLFRCAPWHAGTFWTMPCGAARRA